MPPWSIRRSNWPTSPPKRSTTRCGPRSSASPGCSRRIRGPTTAASCCAPRRRATIGGRGQVVYAAANRMLDAMAHRLRAEGLDCVSVQWGQWTVHFDLDATSTAQLAAIGVIPMTPADALAVGMREFHGNAIVLAYDFDLARPVLEAYGYGPLISRLSAAARRSPFAPLRIRTSPDGCWACWPPPSAKTAPKTSTSQPPWSRSAWIRCRPWSCAAASRSSSITIWRYRIFWAGHRLRTC